MIQDVSNKLFYAGNMYLDLGPPLQLFALLFLAEHKVHEIVLPLCSSSSSSSSSSQFSTTTVITTTRAKVGVPLFFFSFFF